MLIKGKTNFTKKYPTINSFLKVKCECCNYTIGFSEYEQIIIHETEILVCEDCKS